MRGGARNAEEVTVHTTMTTISAGVPKPAIKGMIRNAAQDSAVAAVIAHAPPLALVADGGKDDHGNQPGGDRSDVVVEPENVHAEGVNGEVDGEADPPDETEAHELQPVGGTTHTVQKPEMRAHLNGRDFLRHPSRVAGLGGGRPR